MRDVVEEFVDGLRAGEPRAVEAANRLLGTMAHKHPPTELTPRQHEVVGLLCRGFTEEEIAEQLYLSPHTVHDHVKRARKVLGARTRAHIVSLWLMREAA